MVRFSAENCTVIVAHTTMDCVVSGGAGSRVSWLVTIAWQSSASPSTSFAPPSIAAVTCGADSCSALSTLPGGPIVITGTGFGPAKNAALNVVGGAHGGVVFVPPIGGGASVQLQGCAVTVASVRIECTSPGGFGVGYALVATVLGQASAGAGAGAPIVSFGVPVLTGVNVSSAADGQRVAVAVAGTTTLTVLGRNIGGVATLLLGGAPVPGVATAVPDAAHASVTFTLQGLPRPLSDAPALRVGVRVAGIVDVPSGGPNVTVAVAPPQLAASFPVSAMDTSGAGGCGGGDGGSTHLGLSGVDFGSDVTALTVSISGARCAVCSGATDSSLSCATNATSGDIIVTRGGLSSVPVPFSLIALLAPPLVLAVQNVSTGAAATPSTAGGDAMHVVGTGFRGDYPLLLLPGGAARNVSTLTLQAALATLRPCAVSAVQPTSLLAVVPPGIGPQALLFVAHGRLYVGGIFAYAAPAIVAVTVVQRNGSSSSSNISSSGLSPAEAAEAAAGLLPTTGGTVRLSGADFGSWSSAVTVLAGAAPCVVLAVTDTAIECTAPPGDVSSVPLVVTVGGAAAAASPAAALHYAPPAIDGVIPPTAPTAGGVNAMITGRNFMVPGGPCPSVTLVLPSPLPRATARVLSCTPTQLLVVVPPGASGGSNSTSSVIVAVAGGHQTGSSAAGGVFAYDPPRLLRAAPTGHDAPVGGFTLTIWGSNFGRPGLGVPTVTIRGAPCPVSGWSDSNITCAVPPGSGAGYNVTVTLLGRASTLAAAVSYDPPRVTSVLPGTMDERIASGVVLVGSNFAQTALAMYIDGQPCASPVQLFNSSAVGCASARVSHIGRIPITLVVDGQASNAVNVLAECRVGYYGLVGDPACDPCPLNAFCPGGAFDPVATAGYWQLGRTSFVACVPAEACLAGVAGNGSTCAAAYTGVECRSCAPLHYRSGQNCVQCPHDAWVLVVLFVVGVLGTGALAAWMHRNMFNIKGLTIGVDMMQTLSIFSAFNFAWPTLITGIFSAVSVSTFSPELTAPECTISFTYEEKWALVELFPIIVSMLLMIAVAVSNLVEIYKTRRSCSSVFRKTTDVLVGGIFTLLYYTYFVVVRRALEVFSCAENTGGFYTLNADPSIRCWEAGSQQVHLVPWAIFALVAYGAGVPGAIAAVSLKYRVRIQRDQRLWLAGRGATALDNPDYSVRRRFAKLFQDYKPELFAWRLVLLARKLCLVCIVELTGRNAMFQASLSLAVLAVAYGLHAKYHPFVTSVAQARALAEHSRRGSGRGTDTTVRAAQAKRLSRVLGRPNSDVMLQMTLTGAQSALANIEVLLDFNVLETTLLCTSTAVLLGGMMFESSQLAPGTAAYVVVTICVAVVTVGSVLLFAFMVVQETRRTCRRRVAQVQASQRNLGVASGAAERKQSDGMITSHLSPIFRLADIARRRSAAREIATAEQTAARPPGPLHDDAASSAASASSTSTSTAAKSGARRLWGMRPRLPHQTPTSVTQEHEVSDMVPVQQLPASAPRADIVNPLMAGTGASMRARVSSMDLRRGSSGRGHPGAQ